MYFEIVKIVVSLISGGLAGALINEFIRRRNSRLQTIPLIERVNRLANPKLKGFTLARVAGEGDDRRLEEIQNVREYQFTLRNTSTVHLQDAEVQFEFPSDDVEAYVDRPARSKTAPLPIESVAAEPWKISYRWRIPQFPVSDSLEFTFKAVDPTSEKYEVAIYGCERIVIEKSGDQESVRPRLWVRSVVNLFLATVAMLAAGVVLPQLLFGNHSKTTYVNTGECFLSVESHYFQENTSAWPWEGPWSLSNSVTNVGPQKCTWQSSTGPVVLQPGESTTHTAYSLGRPKLIHPDFSYGPDGPTQRATISIYEASQQ